ncbi:hypothetical protein AXG93_3893s1360 [Marchantia polymorpha subsp. ruderalis]|uniref:Uncharacterized protein n=1 Tax=Marchantia polymorpha subsp. ruderalis TaxID=1480154 RepID=A0A176WD36_MARPO|nr:hypothetical protein AXG93_3893s1360 [Marchantia polymorpha subsp. ruderalis]
MSKNQAAQNLARGTDFSSQVRALLAPQRAHVEIRSDTKFDLGPRPEQRSESQSSVVEVPEFAEPFVLRRTEPYPSVGGEAGRQAGGSVGPGAPSIVSSISAAAAAAVQTPEGHERQASVCSAPRGGDLSRGRAMHKSREMEDEQARRGLRSLVGSFAEPKIWLLFCLLSMVRTVGGREGGRDGDTEVGTRIHRAPPFLRLEGRPGTETESASFDDEIVEKFQSKTSVEIDLLSTHRSRPFYQPSGLERLEYLRFANTIILAVEGRKEDALDIRKGVQCFLEEELKLDINDDDMEDMESKRFLAMLMMSKTGKIKVVITSRWSIVHFR